MTIPKSFFPYLVTLNDFSRQKVRVNLVGQTEVTAGDLSVIVLPQGKLMLDTFSIGGIATCSGTGAFVRLPNVEGLIEQIYIEIGSVQAHQSFMMYNQVFDLYNSLQGSWNKKGIRQILNRQPVDATISATDSNLPFQINSWIGFLNSVKVLNTDRLPEVRVMIKWAGNHVLAAANSNCTASSYTLTNLYAQVDMVKLSSLYDELITSKIASGTPLQYGYDNYQVILGNQTGLTGSVRFSSTSDALHKVYGTFLKSDWSAPNKAVDSTTYLAPYFTKGADAIVEKFNSQFQLNSHNFPVSPQENARGEVLLQTMECLNEHKDITSAPHPNLNSLANFSGKFFAHGVSFVYDEDSDENEHTKSGISGLGANLVGAWNYNYSGASNVTVQPAVILHSKSVIEVAGSKAVRVVY